MKGRNRVIIAIGADKAFDKIHYLHEQKGLQLRGSSVYKVFATQA